MRLRDKRESQALKCLVARRQVSAVDLAAAALAGEPGKRSVAALNDLGFKIGSHFVRRGIAKVDQFNRFKWVSR